MFAKFKYFLKKVIPSNYRSKIKKERRRARNFLKRTTVQKTSLEDLRTLLEDDFSIYKNDNLIVSSSYGNLNAQFSPRELINLLQDIVGRNGNIVMPFYPPGNSYEWASKNRIFSMNTTKSSMGILTQVFSEMSDVYKSMHPTKAIVAWGKDAKEIIAEHDKSKTPFYWDSPYGWLLKNGSKSLGLGLKNIPIFHSFEDIILENRITLYQEPPKNLVLETRLGEERIVSTLVHDPIKLMNLMDAGDYVNSLVLNSYKRRAFGFSFCYVVNNQELFEKCKEEFNNDNFRYIS